MKTSVAIVIPTRNRADLAIAAIRSLLASSDPRLLHVIVSNNSSEPEHVRQLADFCAHSADARLVHIRPPRPLPMAEHWDWATQQALERSGATHFALHYDRRVSTPRLRRLFELTERWPDVAITYLLDAVYPLPPRFVVQQPAWTGDLYEIRTSTALQVAARGMLTDRWQSFPVLVNCVTPRAVIDRVRERFGDVCASTSPESCFGFRLCATEERYLHFDAALGTHYGYARSNGLGYVRGETSGTFADFVRLFGDRPWLEAAPIPGLSLGQNTFYNEYALVRREAGTERFPPIEMDGYLRDLARGLAWLSDPARRAGMREVLVRHGWTGDAAEHDVVPAAPPSPSLTERLRNALARLRADRLPLRRGSLSAIGFNEEARAVRYAQTFPPPPVAENGLLAALEPVRHELP